MASTPAAPVQPVDQDAADLAQYGYKQELKRSLNIFSSFAVAFSYISPATGIFTLFILGIGTLGGAFFWTWPVVWLGQFIVALVFAEVSTHFPLAGSVFQWTKYLTRNKAYAWYAGWIYLWAGALTVAAVVATLPLALIPMIDNLGISGIKMDPASLTNQKWIAAVTLIVITMLNIFGVRLVALINNTGVLFEILGLFVFAIILALFNHHQSVGVVFHTGGPSFNASNFLIAMFMGLFVIYGFDTASTLAEESHEPRKKAPQAVLASIAAAGVIGGVFIYAMLIATPGQMSSVIKAGGISPAAIIDANLSNALSVAYLLVVSVAIFVCCLSIQASTIRLGYGMSRDRQLPFSGAVSRVNERTGTPIGACLMVALMAAIFLLKYAGVAYIAIAATGMIYLSYLFATVAILRVRMKGWPHEKGDFSLGRWGMLINVLAIIWGGGMLINFAWHRVATNPKASEIPGLDFWNSGFLNSIPILWLILGAVLLIGSAYYWIRRAQIPSPVVTETAAAESA
ncbi:MAG TPA: amino acid permease [Thermoleophilaceae bacterium]